jgi:hypothetical protein
MIDFVSFLISLSFHLLSHDLCPYSPSFFFFFMHMHGTMFSILGKKLSGKLKKRGGGQPTSLWLIEFLREFTNFPKL